MRGLADELGFDARWLPEDEVVEMRLHTTGTIAEPGESPPPAPGAV